MDATDTATVPATASIILALDVGSSSVRCTAYKYNFSGEENNTIDIDTRPIHGCSSSIPRPGVEPITGSVRTHGLLEAVDSAIDEVLSKLREGFGEEEDEEKQRPTVEAVGFSTFAMNLIAVDDHGELVPEEDNGHDQDGTRRTVGISYACNSPDVHVECQRLREELGPESLDKLYQATGAPLHSAYALPQLRVLYKDGNSRMGLLQGNHRWQSIAGYCVSRWTNRRHLPMTYSEASWTGLLNVRDCVYEESALRLLPTGCRAALPELTDFTEYLVGIPQFLDDSTHASTKMNPYWTRFPELRDAKFFLGIGDGACANVGSKCTTSSRIAVTVGTSAAVRMCLRHPSPSSSQSQSQQLPFQIPACRGLFCYRIDRNHVLVGGALTDGGSIVEWASKLLNLEKDKSAFQNCLEETQKLVEAECNDERTNTQHRNLMMAPFLSGERSTGFRDGAAGAMFGFTRETTPAHFFKTCLEGVSLRLKAIIDLLLVVVDRERLQDGGGDPEDETFHNTSPDNHNNTILPVMVASGKAMEVNNVWRQMIADSCGLRVVLDKDTTEGTSRGVARLVAMSLLEEQETACSGAKPLATIGLDKDKDSDGNSTKISLEFAKHKEDLQPFLTSQPRSTATTMYAKKFRLQEGFIDSITPFFSSS